MVQFVDKNPSDFTNHMITQHKAFFSMEMFLAYALMDEKESQNIIGQHVFPKSYTHTKKEEEVCIKEEDIKKEQWTLKSAFGERAKMAVNSEKESN